MAVAALVDKSCRPGSRVSPDAGWVVIGSAGDEARSEDEQKPLERISLAFHSRFQRAIGIRA